MPGPNLHVRDLCPHSLHTEQRCGLFFREGGPCPLCDLDSGGGEIGELGEYRLASSSAGRSSGEVGLPAEILSLVGVDEPLLVRLDERTISRPGLARSASARITNRKPISRVGTSRVLA